MKIGLSALAAAFAVSAAPAASAAEIRIVPGDAVVVNSANGRGFSDLILHAIAIRAAEDEALTIDRIRIDLMEKGEVVMSEYVTAGQITKDTGELAGAPVSGFISGQLLSPSGLEGVFSAPTTISRSLSLSPGQAVVTTRRYFAARSAVDSVRVIAVAHNSAGAAVSFEHSIPARSYHSPIEYHAPLKGVWLMQAIPTLQSHHRFNPPTEFAVDFFKIDAEGRLFSGDQLAAENWYGFGADVLAAADGEVVAVTDGEVQDRAAFARRPDESPQAAGERIGAFNMERMRRDFGRAAAGNLIVIRHERDGVVEYSSYGHLRRGIPVKVGDRVRQGQLIGNVGDTGDSAAAHLHFQVNAGPNPFSSKSLPVRLRGLRNAGGNAELGRLVAAE